MKIFYFIFIASIILVSCEQRGKIKNRKSNLSELKYHLQAKDSISFHLDSVTSYFFVASEYNKKMNIYSFLFNKSILLYDYDSQHFLKKIEINSLHPTSYTIKDLDSILVFDYDQNEILLADSVGHFYKRIKVDNNIPYYPAPIVKTAPIILNENNIIFWGNMGGEYADEDSLNRKLMGNVDMQSGKTSYQVSYSDVYKYKNWGGGLYRWIYVDYNSLIDKFIISFPADHNIYTISSKGNYCETYYAGSKFIDAIYYERDISKYLDSEERTRFFAENNSYANIMYDPYNNIYYRIAEMKTIYEGKMGWQKDISVIILDTSFNIIGETFIGKCNPNYRYAMFVNEYGLHIPQKTSEDVLQFRRYKLCIE